MAIADIRPASEAELCEAIVQAGQLGRCVAICGGGSKSDFGRETGDARILNLSAFTGVVAYDPPELVLTVRPMTPLAEVQALVAAEGQMLAFEPFDPAPIFGWAEGTATIGGTIAAGIAGSQRLSAGGARDHLLGVRAVSGRGELFVGGGKVVKNVTGYDMPKLLAGSWGRLAAMTELTLKVLPAPQVRATLILAGLAPDAATAAMARAMGSTAEVAACAHLPGAPARTLFRLQGFPGSVVARRETLARVLADVGPLDDAGDEGEALWAALRTLSPLASRAPLWRISVPPSKGAVIAVALERQGARWLMDWAGGLVWAAFQGDQAIVRDAAREAGGHAQLWRAPAQMRETVPALHPPEPGLAALEARVRRAFDPAGLFETGRF